MTLFYTFFGTAGALIVGLFAAMLLDKSFRGQGILRGLYLFPYVAPVIAVAINQHTLTFGNWAVVKASIPLRFVALGALLYTAASFQGSLEALRSVNTVTHFTHYTVAHAHLGAYGFVTFVLFGYDRVQAQAGGWRVFEEALMLWVVAQNAGFGVFSLVSGRIADARGNRLVIRLQVLILSTTPLLALALASLPDRSGATLFWLPFAMLGLTPLTFRTINNYVLELAPPEQHPRFISTLNLVLAVPFVASPLVGLLIDQLGFLLVFTTISGVVCLGGLLTFRMTEPRHEHGDKNSPPVDIDEALQ